MSWFTTCSENSKPENIGDSGEPDEPIDHKLLSSFKLRTELHFSCYVNIQPTYCMRFYCEAKDDDDGQK